MINALLYIFTPANFEPHGQHFVNTPVLFWVFIVANLLTFTAYMLIPAALIYFVRKRKDLMFTSIFLLFGAFIVLCGVHHLLHTITFWYPIYGIEVVNDAVMALVSIGTFFALLPVIPLALKLRSPQELAGLNKQLSEEIETRKHAEEILKKNEETLKNNQALLSAKNEELETLNAFMVGREITMVKLKKEIEDLRKKANS